ncbi:MAG: hypothetical protein JOZ17_17720 [Acetobacteraceae bacterium]|nr:hypothetical protein [Acetobacteraceae bacterium]
MSTWPWLSLALSGTRLAVDSQQVIALRLAKLAEGGRKAEREASLMVSEKMKALADSQRLIASAAASGQGARAARKVLGLYQKRVSANKKRLSKRKKV